MRLKTGTFLVVASALALGACGSGGTSSSSSTTTPPVAAATTTTATTTTTTAGAPGSRVVAIDEIGRVTLDHSAGIGNYYEKGTIAGTYDGTMTMHAQLKSQGVAVSFTAKLPGGSVSGKGLAVVSIGGGAALDPLNGYAAITSGTGKFAHARARRLKVVGKTALDGSKAIIHLTGNVTY
jgi:hypothetical protein